MVELLRALGVLTETVPLLRRPTRDSSLLTFLLNLPLILSHTLAATVSFLLQSPLSTRLQRMKRSPSLPKNKPISLQQNTHQAFLHRAAKPLALTNQLLFHSTSAR